MLVGGWLRFHELGSEAFWGDEYAYLYLDTAAPGAHHAYSHGFDFYVRCYARVVHLWGGSLNDEFTMRMLPAALGTLVILLLFACGVACSSPAVGVLAAAVMAVHPFAVEHSRTATQYGHLLFGTTWLLWSYIVTVKRARWWTWLSLVLASAFVYHLQVLYACFVVAVWLCLPVAAGMRMYVQRRAEGRFLLWYGASAGVLALLCAHELIVYVLPSMTSAGRLNPSAESLSLMQRMDLAYLRGEWLSGRTWQQWGVAVLAAIGLLVPAMRRSSVSLLTLAVVAVAYAALSCIRMQSTIGVPPRYIAFLLPVFWLVVAAGVWGIAQMLGLAIARTAGRPASWRVAGYAARAVAALVMMPLLFLSWQDVLRGEYVLGGNAWRDLARFLERNACAGDVILTGYDQALLRHYLTNAPCELIAVSQSYDGRTVTIAQIQEYQRRYPRIWSVAVNNYFRWTRDARVQWMDKECVLLAPEALNLHYWSREEAPGWTDPRTKRAREIRLLKAFLEVNPTHYSARRQLARACFDQEDYAASIEEHRKIWRQYLLDPWNYEMPGICYRDGLGVPRDLGAALRCFRWMYWVSELQSGVTRDARADALRNICEVYRLKKQPRKMLKTAREWRAAIDPRLPASIIGREMVRIDAQEAIARRILRGAVEAGNLVRNGSFVDRLNGWMLNQAAIMRSNMVGALYDFAGWHPVGIVRLASPGGTGVGIQQMVPLLSGAVYRLSGMARSVEPSFSGRVVISPSSPSIRLDWYGGDTYWERQSIVFTSMFSGFVCVEVQAGITGTAATGEFTDIELFRLTTPSATRPFSLGPPGVANLMRNGQFREGLSCWQPLLDSVRTPACLTTGWRTVDSMAVPCARIANAPDGINGIYQIAWLLSNATYRMSAAARVDSGSEASELVVELLPPRGRHVLVWTMAGPNWDMQSLVFTNQVAGAAVLTIHVMPGTASVTGEFADVRLERLGE